MKWIVQIARRLSTILITVLLGALLSATLLRIAPGFNVDERQLDPRLNAESVAALRAARARDANLLSFYGRYLHNALHGDLGKSQTLDLPVRQLLRERLPVTARLITYGLLLGWTLAFALAITSAMVRLASYDLFTVLLAATVISIPSAALALLLVFANAPGFLAISLVVFARVFRYCRNVLDASYALPHLITARAKGLGNFRVLFWHVLPVSAPQLLATFGISVSMALGTAVPVEALCGIPGIGQLTWQAALGRDLPLLVTLMVIVTVVTLVANSIADIMAQALRMQPA